MSFIWSIYGQEKKKKRSNAFLDYFLGEITVDRKIEWMSVIQSHFSHYEMEQMMLGDSLRIYFKNHPSVASINLGRTHIQIHFLQDFLPHFPSFIEQMFPGEILGISFSGCDVTKRGLKVISIQENGVELFKDGLDQLKNTFYTL